MNEQKNNFDVLGLISSAFSFEVHKVHTYLLILSAFIDTQYVQNILHMGL